MSQKVLPPVVVDSLGGPSETKQHYIKSSPVRTCPKDVASDLPNTVTVQRWRFALIHPRQHCSGGIDAQ